MDEAAAGKATIGPFELEERIGLGGVGEVWRCKESGVSEAPPLAIKLITPSRVREERVLSSFLKEVQVVARLNHSAIVQVFDYGKVTPEEAHCSGGLLTADQPYLVMELASRGSLLDLKWPLAFEDLFLVLSSILDGLAYAHARGLLHCDLKPANVLLAGVEDLRPGLRLTDFGIAHVLGEPGSAEADHSFLAGTPHYMAPEQLKNSLSEYGPWTDLYALGCLGFELVTGEPPFMGRQIWEVGLKHLSAEVPPLRARAEDVPAGFEGWIQRLLEKNPRDRFVRAADALKALHCLARWPHESKREEHDVLSICWQDKPPSAARAQQPVGLGLGLYEMREVPLVDRERERESLWNSLQAVRREGAARVVLLRGPTGLGKSRLARWLVERAHELGVAETATTTHSPNPLPGQGLTRLIEQSLNLFSLSREECREVVVKWLSERNLEDEYLAAAIVQLVRPSHEAATDRARRSIRFSRPQERYNAIRRVLAKLAEERLLILWLDDVHWGHDSLKFVEHLLAARESEPVPILVVLTADDEQLIERPTESRQIRELLGQAQVEELRVGPLTPSDHADLVRRLLRLEGEVAAEVEARTQGNPSFAVELVGDWVRRGVLEAGRRGFVLTNPLEARLPEDLKTIWAERIERLLDEVANHRSFFRRSRVRDDASLSLEVAAFLGREFTHEEWMRCCVEAGCEPPGELLDLLVKRSILVPTRQGWSFVNSLVRECLELRAIDGGRQALLGAACAAMLESAAFAPEPERLGWYLIRAGQLEGGYSSMLEGVKRLFQHAELESALFRLEQVERALKAGVCEDLDPKLARLRLWRARIWLSQEELAGARSLAREVGLLSEERGWEELLAESLEILAAVERRAGNCEAALDLFSRALTVHEAAARRQGVAAAMIQLGRTHRQLGDLEQAARLLVRARDLADDEELACEAERVLGAIAMEQSEFGRALELTRQSLAYSERVGDRFRAAFCENRLGEIHRHRGELEEAERSHQRSLELFSALGESEIALVPRLNLAKVQLAKRRYRAAMANLRSLEQSFDERSLKAHLGVVRCLLATCHAGLGDWPGWGNLISSAVPSLRQSEYLDRDIAWALESMGQIALEAEEYERAALAFELALHAWQGLGEVERARAAAASLESLGQLQGAGQPGDA